MLEIFSPSNKQYSYGLQKGGVFSEDSLPYLWNANISYIFPCYLSNWHNSHRRCALSKSSFKNCSICVLFGNKIGAAIIFHGTTKRRLPSSHNAIHIFNVVLTNKD